MRLSLVLAALLAAVVVSTARAELWLVGKLGPGLNSAPGRQVSEDARYRLVEMSEADADAAKAAGFMLKPGPRTKSRAAREESPDRIEDERFAWRPDSLVARVVAQVSLDSLARDIRWLQDFRTRYTTQDSCDSCAARLLRRFAAYGCSTEFDRYRYQGNLSFNVIATIPGDAVPESIVVMCGHFDSYSPTPTNAPGADDNATGTAILLEAARLFQQARFRYTVKLVGFSGEEQWLKGSYHWVDSVVVPQQMKIDGVYNVDMIGYTSADSTYHVVNYNDNSTPLAALCDSINEWYSIGMNRLLLYYDPDCAGDNTPFWERGIKAVFALEDSEWGIWNGSNPHYHTTHDTFGFLRMGQVRRVAQMCIGALATHAGMTEYTGTAEPKPAEWRTANAGTSIIRNVLFLPNSPVFIRCPLYSPSGRKLLSLSPGPNDLRGLAAGVYFLKPGGPDAAPCRVVKLR